MDKQVLEIKMFRDFEMIKWTSILMYRLVQEIGPTISTYLHNPFGHLNCYMPRNRR